MTPIAEHSLINPSLVDREGVIIVSTHIKGGVGKTMVTNMVAANLIKKGYKFEVIDGDTQNRGQIITYEKTLEFFGETDYEVIEMPLDEITKKGGKLDQAKQPGRILIIDLPGGFRSKSYIEIILQADILLIPFTYTEDDCNSTEMIGAFIGKLQDSLTGVDFREKTVLIPNKMRTSVKYELEQIANEAFSEFAYISPKIPFRKILETKSTLLSVLDRKTKNGNAIEITQPAIDFILNKLNL